MKVNKLKNLLRPNHTNVMGIINVTPDSFYANSRVNELELLNRVEQMIKDGVEIIDIGGESTRPGADPVPLEEEIKRVVPAVKMIRKHFDIPISVDTYKAEVAKLSLEEGADIINDISALRMDERMINIVSYYKCPIIIMHMKGTPKTMQQNPQYDNVVGEIIDFFKERIEYLKSCGIEEIIIDPGIGFGKTLQHNLEILNKIDEFRVLGQPILIGASRKSMIGMILDKPPEERLNGTLAITAYCTLHNVEIVRVHDVRENVEVVKVIEAIKGVKQ
ncbi:MULTISPECIES: dihydropteroate synthase [Fervidobacterium]|uniref:Dihydropteroate synthase n=1 Tax=Fervidobacterium nodosum (strain ATCC 35602 / DSM 5306 / Rt17-B1) TaxID=381764 RepID=A7HJ82_FERNB|nr:MULTISPECIES: dihydropteroate synthase [Fervidobacterium]ABS59965.1 dihydropteroate synthase [Fervidobacterium nodosum Rt17-B1]KAF2961671.1 dihydropteroate synthase [Fervidobacterium sp. 2310opik-2]PHJ13819.1 dihydropteroate synthase [Fervidobacterium sp. SC_NGM5_G05]